MDTLAANPEKFVGEKIRVEGRVGFVPEFTRDTQILTLIPVGCKAYAGRLEASEGATDAFNDCYGGDAEQLIQGAFWFVHVPDDLDIHAGDIVTIEATIGVSGGGGARIYSFYDDIEPPFTESLPVVSVEKDGG